MNHESNLVRLFIVKSCQEFNGRIGIIEAAKGIETRSNLKTNRFFIDILRTNPCDLQELLQAHALGMLENTQTIFDQNPILICQADHVSNGPNRYQV